MGTAAEVTEAPAAEDAWTATGHEVPVFYDHGGRRRHVVAGAGALLAVAAIGWMGGLVSGSVGFSDLHVRPAVSRPYEAIAPLRHDHDGKL